MSLHFTTRDPRTSWAVLNEDGHMIASHHAHTRQDPASCTKMATIYTIGCMIERGELPRNFFRRHSDTVDLMALRSNNNAATELATLAGHGSLRRFVRQMNHEMDRIGLDSTHFVNANGMPARGHYTTARDLALLAHHFENDLPQFEHILGRDTARIGRGDYERTIRNTGRDIIGNYADFGKTGTGTLAGPNGRRSFVGGCDEGAFAILDTGRSTSIRRRFARAAHFLLHGRSDNDEDRPRGRTPVSDLREIRAGSGDTISEMAESIALLDGRGGIEVDEAMRLLRAMNRGDLRDGRLEVGDEIVVPRTVTAARNLMRQHHIS